jgi:hypothetical protein
MDIDEERQDYSDQGNPVYLERFEKFVALEMKLRGLGEKKSESGPATIVKNSVVVASSDFFARIERRADELRAGAGIPVVNNNEILPPPSKDV